ncbi:MAG TPA: universal stress protein [Nitrososphaeraceae archaeon]|nr:universal stress protein [Nitrososphaeraceae archaeon]
MSDDTKFKNILVPLDGSQYSLKALEYAYLMAKGFNAKLTSLYVIPSSIRYNSLLNKENAEINSSFKQIIQVSYIEAQKWLKGITQKRDIEIVTEVIIAEESIVSEIIEFAERKKIDLIIMGTMGRTGFKKILLGSVASAVVTYSHCPVLVIR